MPPQCDPTSRKKKKKEKEEVWGFEVLYVFLINFAFSYSEEVLETGKEAKLVFRSNLLGYLHAESEKKKVCPTKWRKIRHTIFVFFIRGILCNARTEQGREGDRSGRPSIPPPSSKADVKPLFFAHKKRDKKAKKPKRAAIFHGTQKKILSGSGRKMNGGKGRGSEGQWQWVIGEEGWAFLKLRMSSSDTVL